jgi:hypothetical protein
MAALVAVALPQDVARVAGDGVMRIEPKRPSLSPAMARSVSQTWPSRSSIARLN